MANEKYALLDTDFINQTTFKIQDTSKEKRLCKVPCEQVLEEIFEGKLEELQTGDIKYL